MDSATVGQQSWRLDGGDRTLLLTAHGEGVPQLAWLGASLPVDLDSASLCAMRAMPLPHASVDTPDCASLFPTLATGHAGPPALRAHRDGAEFGHAVTLRGVSECENRLEVSLEDSAVGIRVSIGIQLDPDSGVCRWDTTLTNTASAVLTVDWLAAASVELPQSTSTVDRFTGRWGQELQRRRSEFDGSPLLLESWRGRTGHQSFPGVVVGDAEFGCHHGNVHIAHLAWSGNHRVQLQRDDNGVPVLQMGVAYHPGECRLDAGESVTTPPVFIAGGHGTDGARQRLHHYARQRVLPEWTRTPRPIHCNSWEAVYFNHKHVTLTSLIDAAAEAGAERFVLDDGWFQARRDDTAGLGDWWVDADVYPEGLHPIVAKVRERGLQFGLWFEPEMVNPDSDLMREHPEWVLRLDGVETPLARNQMALDLSREDVCDYLYERIAELVETYAIDYIKWDMNRDLVLPGDGQRAVAAQQPPAVLSLMKRLQACFPTLEIESCASGGGRLDWGLLEACGRVWLSDNLDPIDRVRMQADASVFLPREILGSHLGHARAHLTGRQTSIGTRAIVALGGQFGFETDLRGLTSAELAELSHYTALYKAHRCWLADAVHWQLVGLPVGVLGEGRVSVDQRDALYSIVVTQAPPDAPAGSAVLCGLDDTQNYAVSICNASLEELAPFNRLFPAWCADGVTLPGGVLGQLGLQLPVMPAQTALLIHCKQER